MTAAEAVSVMGDWALFYAERDWPVFPLHTPTSFGPKAGAGRATCSCQAPDCDNQGKHPRTRNGLSQATTDAGQVRQWWQRWPDANIGLLTGVAFDVLDLDGMDAIDALDTAGHGQDTVVGPMVGTGKGVHVYVEPTGAGNRAGMLDHVDWRGRGGYVVAPPSIHYLAGDRYEWSELHGPDEPLAPCPQWLARIVRKETPPKQPGASPGPLHGGASRYGQRALESEVGRVAMAPEGQRNHTLNCAALALGQLVAGGELDASTVAHDLLLVAQRIGLGETEAVATIKSGMTAGMLAPRKAAA